MLDAFDGCCLYDESSRIPEANDMESSAGYSEALLQKKWLGTVTRNLHLQQSTLFHFRTMRQENFFFVKPKYIAGSVQVSAQPGGFQQLRTDAKHCPDSDTCPHLLVVGDYLFDSTLNGVLDSAEYAAGWIATMTAEQELDKMNTNTPHGSQENMPKRDADVAKNTVHGRHEEVRFPSISEKHVINLLKIYRRA